MTELCFNTMNHSAYFGGNPDLPAQIEAAAAAGFRLFGPDLVSLDAWLAGGRRLDELVALMDSHGLRCGELAGAVNVTERAESIQEARHAAELAAVLKPTWVQVNVTVEPNRAVYRAFHEICDILAAGGARAALEYLPFTPVNSIAAAQRLVEHVGTDRAGVMVDSWHHFRGPDTDAELEALPVEMISYVQFDDALPSIGDDVLQETLHRRVMPGEGEFDLEGFSRRLRAKGFDGIVSIEVLSEPWRTRSKAEFARAAYETSRRFWP